MNLCHEEKTGQEQYSECLNQSLFSIPSIQSLDLSTWIIEPIDPHQEQLIHPIHLNINNSLISNLPNLTQLHLSGGGRHVARRQWIESETLLILDVTNLRRVVLQCHCPQLQEFRCDALKYSGSLPDLITTRQFSNLMRNHVVPPGRFGDLILSKKGTLSFPGLDVPNSCRIVVYGFGYWKQYLFRSYGQRLEEIQLVL